jgi:hypothetical protein
MKFAEKSLPFVLGALLMAAAANSLALSLGRMRGATLVGRPLDVTLTARLDGTEGLSAACVAADVFFGDSRVAQDKVRVVTSQGVSGEALIRIRTSSGVDEPVVTLYVHEGCLQKNTRKYVLLAEVAGENASPVPVVGGEVVAAVPLVAQMPAAPGTGSNAARAQAGSFAPSSPGKAQRARPEKIPPTEGSELRSAVSIAPLPAAPAVRRAGKPTSEPAHKPRSRLKLDPIDLAAERDPVLRSSPELLTEPSADAQQRAAAAALWQALNAQPQDMVRDNQRLKSLEADVAGMLARSQKTEKAVMEMRGQLEQARGERYNNWLVYALCAFLATSLLGILALWMRSRQHSRQVSRGSWWGKEFAEDSAPYMAESTGTSAKAFLRRGQADESVSAGPLPDSLVDFDPSEPLSEAPRTASSPGVRSMSVESKFPAEFLPSLSGISSMPRIVNAEELFDVQQQADFFLSLGRPDKAVEVLRLHIMDNVETSALVYLDLFDLYHSLGRRDDYDALRTDFNKMFNAKVPAFDEYTADTHDLEFYTAALSRIEALWPTSKVLDVLEESIFRKPDSRSEVFSLAAYRELLLLHSIAKKIVTRPAGDADAPVKASAAPFTALAAPTIPDTLPGVAGFGPTSIQPLSARFQNTPPLPSLAVITAPDPTQPPASPRIGLDIDLSVSEDAEFAPFPSIEAGTPLPEAVDNNLIEFDLDFPVSSVPVHKT